MSGHCVTGEMQYARSARHRYGVPTASVDRPGRPVLRNVLTGRLGYHSGLRTLLPLACR